MSKISPLQQAYILHTRNYRETSMIADFFTLEHGRVSAVARGVRRKKSGDCGLLQPFVPLLISWFGKRELVSLAKVEMAGSAYCFSGKYLVSALYLNELLMRLMQRHDPHPKLFEIYGETLECFRAGEDLEITLRLFEISVLKEIGYGLEFNKITATGEMVQCGHFYQLTMEPQILLVNEVTTEVINNNRTFCGESLLAIHDGDFSTLKILKDAKALLRLLLKPLLGNKPLKSRELFVVS